MKSFYIVTNKSKDPDGIFTYSIRDYLLGMGARCSCNIDNSDVIDSNNYTDINSIPKDIDCIIVLGGDGTLIQAARELNSLNLPFLGVNIGTLGYLTDTDRNTVFETLDSILEDDYEYDTRMMLDGEIYSGNKLEFKDIALNDIVISRNGALRIIGFEIFVNGEYLNKYNADGVIVSTATGSTAYSLSAGGPIIQPNAKLILITPICPHSLNQRSLIFGADDVIKIKMCIDKSSDYKKASSLKSDNERVATFDGESYCALSDEDEIIIKQSDKVSRLIKTSKISFLERIRNKM